MKKKLGHPDITDFPLELKIILEILSNDSSLKNDYLFSDIDWDSFLKLSYHHRLYSIIYSKLKNDTRVPPHVVQTLSEWYKQNSLFMLHLSAEMERVNKWFYEVDIRTIFLKGPILAYDLFGDLSLRTSKDLDILIHIQDLDKVNQLLLKQGYIRDGYQRTILNDWKWKNHHIEYFNPEKGISLEIHWKLNPGACTEPTFKELWSRKRTLFFHEQPIFFLGREDLFVYLVTHGARHGWFRLRWLHDIHQIIRQGIAWKKTLNGIKKSNAKHLVGQALILASSLFHTPIPSELKPFTFKDKAKSLAQKTLFFIKRTENLHSKKLPDFVLAQFEEYSTSIMNFRQKCLVYFGYIFPVPGDDEILPLPKKLHFLYFLLRPILWTIRKLRNRESKHKKNEVYYK